MHSEASPRSAPAVLYRNGEERAHVSLCTENALIRGCPLRRTGQFAEPRVGRSRASSTRAGGASCRGSHHERLQEWQRLRMAAEAELPTHAAGRYLAALVALVWRRLAWCSAESGGGAGGGGRGRTAQGRRPAVAAARRSRGAGAGVLQRCVARERAQAAGARCCGAVAAQSSSAARRAVMS